MWNIAYHWEYFSFKFNELCDWIRGFWPSLPAVDVLMGIPIIIIYYDKERLIFSDVWKSWEPSLFLMCLLPYD